MTPPDKARRKELLRHLKQQERVKARGILKLTPEQLDHLHDFLEQQVEADGCDHTLRFTVAWAKARRKSITRLLEALEVFGGYCDCEVVLNVTRDQFGWPEREGCAPLNTPHQVL
jgi:hypothetical protein